MLNLNMSKQSLVGFIIIFTSIIATQVYHGSALAALFDFPAFLIVFGGTLGAMLVQTSPKQFWHSLVLMKIAFQSSKPSLKAQSTLLLKWAQQARKVGLLSLEKQLPTIKDPFTKKGIGMLVDGNSQYILEDILQQEIELESEHCERSAQVFESMGGYSPTIGIIGAVFGLIQAMSYLDRPDKLGASIAVAFISTLYGVGFANFIYLPIANKIRLHYQYVALYQEMSLVGMVAILNGEHNFLLKHRLKSYINRAAY
jgi:chemotaxis protein MotA